MFVKFCGFTRPEDIEKVMGLPLSSVGFIFYKKSKRYVDPQQAGIMSRMLEKTGIKKTGVFVDSTPESIMETVETAGLDMVQVYDAETVLSLSGKIPVIQAIRIGGERETALPPPLPGVRVLFDTYSAGQYGGTGKTFDRSLIQNYPFRDRMIIAGGLNENNISEIIKDIKPGGVDISSGIEISDGIKSGKKISRIMKLIMEAENDSIA
jgi:phosphoribosylanthranilate isomerase